MRELTNMDMTKLKAKIDGLATAKERPVVYVEEGNEPKAMPEYKAIINQKTGEVETVASKGYVIIQHKDAFNAVLDALAAVKQGAQFKASVMEQKGKAWMTVVFSDIKANDDAKGIELGLRVRNSFDKTSAFKYSGTSKDNSEGKFEFFGLRLSCMNGMTMKVNLSDIDLATLDIKEKSEAKVGDFVGIKQELVVRTHETKTYIRHYGKDTDLNLEKVRLMMLALPVVAKRLEQQIQTIQRISLTSQDAILKLKEVGFGERAIAQIMARFDLEQMTQWGLYNAVTAYATHEEKISPLAMERTFKKAELIMEARA